MKTRRRHRVRRAVLWTALGISVAGTLLAATGIKDQWLPTAMVYYATPWLLRWLAGLAACYYGWKEYWMRRVALLMVLCAGIQGISSLSFSKSPLLPPTALLVSTWNSGHDLCRRPDLWHVAGESDLCAIVETGHFTADQWSAFMATNPDESWLQLDGGTAIGVKGKILGSEAIHEPNGKFRAYKVRVSLPRREDFSVIVVDINSQPWFAREPALKAIHDAVASDAQCIILGDFNTPAQSTWLRKWRKSGLNLANDGARMGFRETWPYGIPLWTLDQIWTGPGWETLAASHARYGSDHAKVNVALSVRATMIP